MSLTNIKNPYKYMNNISEIFIPIKSYEGLYEISNLGRIKSLGRKGKGNCINDRIMKDFDNGNSYRYISLTKENIRKNYFIHRLLAEHFIPNPNNKPHVNHKNGIKHDNRIENLEWCTLSENMNHAVKLGLLATPNSKLSKTQVSEIRQKHKDGLTRTQLMTQYNVSRAQIHRIVRNQNWVTNEEF